MMHFEQHLFKPYKILQSKQIKPRYFHTTILYNQSLVIFGGKGTKSSFNTIHTFNTKTKKWNEVKTITEKPTPRYGHAAVKYNNIMYVFGGHNSCDNYLYLFDLIECKWLPKVHLPSIPARYHHTMNQSSTGTLVIFGGKNEHGEIFNTPN